MMRACTRTMVEAAKEDIKRGIELFRSHARSQRFMISLRKLRIWYPPVRKYPTIVAAKALKELMENEYRKDVVELWYGKASKTNYRYILKK